MVNCIAVSFVQAHLLIKYAGIKIKSHFEFDCLVHFFLLTLIYYLHCMPSCLSRIIKERAPITIKSWYQFTLLMAPMIQTIIWLYLLALNVLCVGMTTLFRFLLGFYFKIFSYVNGGHIFVKRVLTTKMTKKIMFINFY